MSVRKSVGKSEAVRRPLPPRDVIDGLVARRIAFPKVNAYEVAARMGIDPASLSRFENGRGGLPRGVTVEHYEAALADLKRAKRLEGAAA